MKNDIFSTSRAACSSPCGWLRWLCNQRGFCEVELSTGYRDGDLIDPA